MLRNSHALVWRCTTYRQVRLVVILPEESNGFILCHSRTVSGSYLSCGCGAEKDGAAMDHRTPRTASEMNGQRWCSGTHVCPKMGPKIWKIPNHGKNRGKPSRPLIKLSGYHTLAHLSQTCQRRSRATDKQWHEDLGNIIGSGTSYLNRSTTRKHGGKSLEELAFIIRIEAGGTFRQTGDGY